MNEYINLNKFTIQEKIGKGAFGKVFKVIESDTKIIYAAKISKSKFNKDDPTIFSDIKSEVSILSQLIHPLVLRFIGYSPYDFNHESHPVIITEYSVNKSLNDIIELDRKHTPPKNWTDTKKLINIYGIAFAMSYLHSHDVVHRDLKPANILEDENFFPKIADFGLSKIGSLTSQSKESSGTPKYMAPEIWNNEYSKAGDVYAYGIIVYELLTLEEPFKNYNKFMLVSKVAINGERPEFDFPLPECYKNLIRRCWSANPKDRPTFQEIVKELRTKREFIIDTIDENEFFEFVDSVDCENVSFEPSKKLKSIISTDDKDYESITVGTFNKFTLKDQQTTISKFIEKYQPKETEESFSNINELLQYISKNINLSNEHYFSICEDEDTPIEEIYHRRCKISLSHEAIDMIQSKTSNDLNELSYFMSKFEIFNINVKYPTSSFETIYSNILKLKQKYFEQLHINIFITGITITDMRFRNDENISTILLGNDVIKISGENDDLSDIESGSFSGCSSLEQIIIPSSVTSICNSAFSGCSSLTQIIIPSSVTSIGNNAFKGCSSLTQITIPSSVIEIGDSAFSGCSSIIQISIPSSATSIGECTFSGCSSLTQIIIPSSVTSIKKSSFLKCSLLRRITIPSSVTSIEESAFKRCSSLLQFNIPSSVTSIGDSAFALCSSLTQITIPSSVTSIGDSAFVACSSLTQITIPSSVISIGKSAFKGCSSLIQMTIPSSVTSIENSTFDLCSSLIQITIPSSVTSIGYNAFSTCSSLEQITIPSSVTSIGQNSFYNCSSLTQITIPSSVISIGNYSFYGCSSLTQIVILSSIIKIEDFVFCGCKSLAQITIPSSVTSIGEYAFSDCSSLAQIIIPSSVTSIGDCSFRRCSSLTQITIPSSVTEIRNYAFSECLSLAKISIPSSLSKIGNGIFQGIKTLDISGSLTNIPENFFKKSTSLIQITIPSSVTSIGKAAFLGCSSLTQITVPSSVTSIGDRAFKGCSSLTQIAIPSFVTSIGDGAFYGCSSLTQITIPSSVTSIGIRIFTACSSLAQVTILSSPTSIGEGAFCGCSSLTQFAIPSSVTSIDNFSFSKCSSLTQITIPSSVTSIGEHAFAVCSSLAQIIIPSSVTSIGEHAFSKCSSLTQIIIPSSVTSIGEHAFSKCSSLTNVSISCSSTSCSIGQFSFSGCLSLTQFTTTSSEALIAYPSLPQIIIPSNVTSISLGDFEKISEKNISPINVSKLKFVYHNLLCENTSIETINSGFTASKISEADHSNNDIQTMHEHEQKIDESNAVFEKTEINKQKQLQIEEFIRSNDTKGLMNYLNDNCNEEETSSAFDNCFLKSKELYLKMCEEGIKFNNAVAHHKYALSLIFDSKVLKSDSDKNENYKKAKIHLEESMKQGFSLSYFSYARLHYETLNKNDVAFRTAKKGADVGEKHSKCLLGFFIAHGIGTEKDFNKGVSMMLSSNAENYYERYATDFGIYYSNIEGQEDKAFYWFEKAYIMKQTRATINNYGICFLRGIGISKDINKAKEIFEIGANLNYANSLYHLGFIFEETDPEYSEQLYEKAAERGNIYAKATRNQRKLLKHSNLDADGGSNTD